MGFSATGTLLDNYYQTLVFYDPSEKDSKEDDSKLVTKTSMSLLNALGAIPVVSVITGISRVLLGIIHTIVHLVTAIFTNREHHLNEAWWGLKNIGRGCIEVVPLIGNLTILLLDGFAIRGYEKIANEKIQKSDEGQVVLFSDGEEMGKLPIADYGKAIAALGREPTSSEKEDIILKKNKL